MKDKLLISFSGGMTSAYMTKWILENWKDKYDIRVIFANTGKENKETLEFVRDCDNHFGFNTIWVEAVTNPKYRKGVSSRVVDFTSANRDGRPFEDMIKKHGLPNVGMAICTRELKERTILAYARSLGWKKYYTAIGIRADEVDRISAKHEEKMYLYPLVPLGIVRDDINKFWSEQSFTLKLKSYQGNCDLCFKKSLRKLLTVIRENPEKLNWWRKMEDKYGDKIPKTRKQTGKPTRFFRGNMSCDELEALSKKDFELAQDESIYKQKYKSKQLSMFDLDVSNGCIESCEVF